MFNAQNCVITVKWVFSNRGLDRKETIFVKNEVFVFKMRYAGHIWSPE